MDDDGEKMEKEGKDRKLINRAYLFARAAVTDCHKLGGGKQRESSASRFRRPQVQVKVSAGLCSLLCPHAGKSGCARQFTPLNQ